MAGAKLVGAELVGASVGAVDVGLVDGFAVGVPVGAAVVGVCVCTTVLETISDVDEASFTAALANELSAGALAAMAVSRLLSETAVVSSLIKSASS